MPIENLIERYDLITIDHPYMGQAFANKLLLPLEEMISDTFLETLSEQSVGPSFGSYDYKNHIYALPIDAAALVAASRNDLMEKYRLVLPKTRQQLLGFYQKIPKGHSVAWPLCPTDLWCTFLTLCAQDAGNDFIKDRSIDEKVGIAVLNELKYHLGLLHPQSLQCNPIQILDRMANEDSIVYAPFLFGYTNYSREGYAKNKVNFSNSPTNPATDISTILGGVGLAVSSKCIHKELAVAYAIFTAKAETQEGIYTQNGGQPGNLMAWLSETNNALCDNFFAHTMRTMQRAYVRPRHAGWNEFQEQGADLLHDGLLKNLSSDQMIKGLNQLYKNMA